jgi:hypothetical protein
MNNLAETLLITVNMIIDHFGMFLSTLPCGGFMPATGAVVITAGVGTTILLALVTMSGADNISGGVYGVIRKWHGKIDDQFGNIQNIITLVEEHPMWMMPPDLLMQLVENRDHLQVLITKCRTSAASSADRTLRNSLLKSTVDLCLLQVKVWAYGQYTAGIITAAEVHLLGFLLPGETGGRHGRTEATNVVAEVKVKIINEDNIRVVIDQSSGENAANVAHGWPDNVRNAVIVVVAEDGKTEVVRRFTTRLHNDIKMPEGSHGKQFIIKASFLQHVDDEPRFGNEPTFSMPLTTTDLVAALDKQRAEESQELERSRLEIERLKAELNEKK